MTYTRIYADAKGETHLEDVKLNMKDSGSAFPVRVSEMIAAEGVLFRTTKGQEYFIDWHNAPRRQFVVNLSGEVEITVSDGGKRRFGAGSILLAEDLTGKGHISRGVGDGERRVMFVPLVG